MAKNKYVYGQSTVKTFAYLSLCSEELLKTAESKHEGSFYYSMAAIMFSVFAVEAHANHAGSLCIEDWEEKERNLDLKEKLKTIGNILNVDVNFGKNPFQRLGKAIKIRNFLAHGKTKDIQGPWKLDDGQDINAHRMDDFWQKDCCTSKAQQYVETSIEIIEMYSEALGESKFSRQSPQSGVYWVPD